MQCEFCKKEYKNIQSLSKHIGLNHQNISKQEYYDNYLKTQNDGICPICNKLTKFKDLNGYNKYCSKSCLAKAQNFNKKVDYLKCWESKKEKIKNFEQHNKCTHINNIREKYGNSFISAIEELNIPIIKISKMYQYIENIYLDDIDNYMKNRSKLNHSKAYKTRDLLNAQFEKDNNCTQISKLIEKYGQGWLALKIPTINRNGHAHFIENKYISQIEKYNSMYHPSNKEKDLYTFIQSIYSNPIKYNTKQIIKPLELDIYLPDIKLAIEYNGIYWHSTKRKNKDYHLKKSLLCRDKNIRLIHIYEFEDLEEQKQLLKDLILGKDTYPKNDFNKNNLIENIPKPEIIYNKDYIVYGAGKLY